ncbi:MAG: penicillin acylase family protein [Alphaproteobacteria bacterium]
MASGGSSRRIRRRVGVGLGLFGLVLTLALGAGYLWLKTSLPRLDGTLRVAGLEAPVEVLRDDNGIPYIRAKSTHDAYFALGFVHAQDRLWQMEANRRLGSGRLSEVLGQRTVGLDRFMRTLGLYRLAQASFEVLSQQAREAITAYSDGVNAYLEAHEGALAPEFYLLRFRPEPWRPADSLIWGKLMAMRLAGNWRDELLRARLSGRLTAQQIEDLWPPYPDDGPITLGSLSRDSMALGPMRKLALDGAALDDLASRLAPPSAPRSASNSWVLSAEHTGTGGPILANDPHLGFRAPNMWYLARITAPGLEIAGATVPGVPFHIVGHNGHIAWGLTTTMSDTEDLFAERLDTNDPGRYLTPDGWAPFALREEVIRVRGSDPVTFTVRETRHGPVLSDAVGGPAGTVANGDVLALAATALRRDDRTPEAFFRLNLARDWSDFVAAMEHFHAPQQNVVYADIRGNIGFYAAGRVPIRKRGQGLVPAPGWSGDYDWAGFIPLRDLPHALNPPSGRIVNANQKIAGDDYSYFLARNWAAPYRARRIHELLDRTGPHTPATTARIQGDVVSLAARELLPLMLSVAGANEPARAALRLLEKWDGTMDRRRPEPLIFSAWLRELNRLVYADELGAYLNQFWGLRPLFIKSVLTRNRQWCDDILSAKIESCEERIRAALARALDDLSAAYGPDPNTWRWGDAHVASFRHRIFGRVPFIGGLADILVATDGDDFTVNRGTTHIRDPRAPFAQVHGPGLRAIYDLENLDRSLFMQATGQSGNPLSDHYRDLIRRWRDLEYVRIAKAPARAKAAGGNRARHRLMLTPK